MKSWSIRWIVVLTCALLAGSILVQSCKDRAPRIAPSESRPLLGTKFTIKIFDEDQVVDDLERVFHQTFLEIEQWEAFVLNEGELNQLDLISQGAGSLSVEIDTMVFEMLMAATRYSDATNKYFDARVGPMYDLWGFESTPRVPSDAELDSVQQFVMQGGMFVAGKTILLAKPGMSFDVRGMLEGYVIDRAVSYLYNMGFRHFTIHTPRVWRFVGTPPQEEGFALKLHAPDDPAMTWATLHVPAGGYAYATATRDQVMIGGARYHSYLDPHTGKPSARARGIVIAAESAAEAQALTYADFVRPSEEELPEKAGSMKLGKVVIRGEAASLEIESSGVLAEKFQLDN